MEKKYRNEEARNVLKTMVGDLIFYFYEYREEVDEWGEAFKTEFNNMVDNIIEEMKEED